MNEGAARFVDDAIHLTLDLRVYRLAAVQKAAYRLGDRFTATIAEANETSLSMTLRFKPGTTEVAVREAARVFFQELLDQELREKIAEETAPIRSLILAHAFSRVDLIRRE